MLQAPVFPFQAPAVPFQTNGAVHDAIVDTAPRQLTRQPQPTEQATAAPADALSDADRKQVDARLSNNEHPTGGDIYDALKGLSKPAQRYLMSHAFKYIGVSGFRGLAESVRGDASVRGIVAEALVKRAVLSESSPGGSGGALDANDPHNYARAFASDALIAMGGDDAGLAELLLQMPPLAGALFAQALGDGDRQGADERVSNARNQILCASNGAPHTRTTGAIVKGLFLQTSLADMAGTPGLADNMVNALARECHPGDTARARAEMPRLKGLMSGEGAQLLFGGSIARKQVIYDVARNPAITAKIFDRQTLDYYGGDAARIPVVAEAMARALIAAADGERPTAGTPAEEETKLRVAGIMQTEPGQRLFFSGKAPAEATKLALQIVRTHPITFETFGGMRGKGNPWLIPELARPIAEAFEAGSRDHAPLPVSGRFGVENLVVGPALGMIPTLPNGEARDLLDTLTKAIAGGTATPEEIREQCAAIASMSLYDKKDQAIVGKIADKIRDIASTSPPMLDVDYVTVFCEYGPIRCPRFSVQNGVDANGLPTYAFVDNTSTDFPDLAAWEEKNQLLDGIVYYRKTDKDGRSILVSKSTPEANKSEAGKVVDKAAVFGCYAMSVAALVVSGGAAAVVAGVAAASGGWMAFRSGNNLYDRYTRGQGVLTLEALGDWLGVVGGVAGAGALAAALKGAASLGALQKLASGVNLAGFGYQAGMLMVKWPELTPEQRDAIIEQTIAIGTLTVAHGAAPQRTAPRAQPGQSPLKALDAGPTATPVAPVPTSQTATPSKTATPATPGPTMVTPPPPHVIPVWKVGSPPEPSSSKPPAGHGQPGGTSPVAYAGATSDGHSHPRVNRRTAPDPKTRTMAGGDKPKGGPNGPAAPPEAESPAGRPAPATGPRVDAVADIAHLEQQLRDAEQRTVELGKPAEDAEKEWRSAIKQQEAEQNQGGVSKPTQVRVKNALAEYKAAEAAENKALREARDLRAQYDSALRAERPADPATGPRVYAVADIERLKQQLSAANERMVELNEQAHLAEAKLDSAVKQQTEEEQREGRVSEPTQVRVKNALAEYRAAEAAEKKALREARDLGAQYDSARRAAPPAAEPSPHAPGGAHAAENLPGGLSGEVKRLEGNIASIEKSLDEPNLPEWKRDVRQLRLANAEKMLAAPKTRLESLEAKAKPLRQKITQLQERAYFLFRKSLDPYYNIADRARASKSHAELQGELDELKTELAKLSRKIDGPEKRSFGPAPKRPAVIPTTEGSAHDTDLELLQAEINRYHAEMAKIERELADPHLHLSQDYRMQLLIRRDACEQLARKYSGTQVELFKKKYKEDRDIAVEAYQRFKSNREPLSAFDYGMVRDHIFEENYVTSTEGMPETEIEAYMDKDMQRLDVKMLGASRRLAELLDLKRQLDPRATPEAIQSAANELDILMLSKMVLEKEFAAKRETVRKEFAIKREEDHKIAAEEYKKFRSQHKPMSADEKQPLLDRINRRIDLKPGMSNADILSRMDSEMTHIDEAIAFVNRSYREMLKENTALPEFIEKEAGELQNWMNLKIVLEEQMAKYEQKAEHLN